VVLLEEVGLAIQARDLRVSYGERYVLRGVDFEVGWGECLVVFGANGAGKTTLMRLLATLQRPNKGSVHVAGVDVWEHPSAIRRLIGVVTHQTLLYDNLTVRENLKFYGQMYRIADAESRIDTLLQAVGLEDYAARRTRILSHGMQKRLTLARSLLHNPPILLLDEPDAGLDHEAQIRLATLLKSEVSQGNRTVVMTTHNLERGLALGDRVMILANGRIVYQEYKSAIDLTTFRDTYEQFTGDRL
jgi:heme exporter protein A